VQAALATPGEGRTVVAVASEEACQRLLGICLDGSCEAQAQGDAAARGGADVAPLFGMSEGGLTMVNWHTSQRELGRGSVLCVNYQLMGGQRSQWLSSKGWHPACVVRH
jgi:hypothetical protein